LSSAHATDEYSAACASFRPPRISGRGARARLRRRDDGGDRAHGVEVEEGEEKRGELEQQDEQNHAAAEVCDGREARQDRQPDHAGQAPPDGPGEHGRGHGADEVAALRLLPC
jgi:hypothetical protein